MPKEEEIAKLAEEKINLTSQELADVIWLMVQIKQSSFVSEVSSAPTTESQEVPSSLQNTEPIIAPEIVEPDKISVPTYTDSSRPQTQKSEFESESVSGLPIKIADPLTLRNALALGRSLRPLINAKSAFFN